MISLWYTCNYQSSVWKD